MASKGLALRVADVVDADVGGWESVVPRAEKLGLEAPVVVDATAAEDGAGHVEWLRRGWSVVTANKKPLAGKQAVYDVLAAARDDAGRRRYFHETTVGAGLPVIRTLQDLLETGDEVREIRAALSGTMGFIFSECGRGRSFAEAVAKAKARGYTEPDPRDDISGTDIARKALILGRMLGNRLEPADVEVESLADVPPDEVDSRLKKAAARGAAPRFLATIRPDGIRVGLEDVPRVDPFAALDGPENLIVFRTARYAAAPLAVRGPGAGAAVTAAGLFADIIRAAV